ncbi:MAG: polysaccharide biosynthesis protein [Acholeplasmatales bacterium]|nr:polysaccharide biosynthesis protein [Acholeplasmatales bacterium]
MNKKKLYIIGLSIIDFFVIFLMFILSLVLITKDFGKINLNFIISVYVIAMIKVTLAAILKTYRMLWMYSIRRNLFKLVSIALLIDLAYFSVSFIPQVSEFTNISTSVFIVFMLMEFAYLVLSRFSLSIYFNYFYKRKEKEVIEPEEVFNTLIIGAGSAGAMVLNDIASKKEYGYKVVGFVDDSEDKIGQFISNVKIYGPISNINNLVKELEVKKIIIAIPSVGLAKLKEITNTIDYKNVSVEILPDRAKMLQSNITSSIRKVEIADLLGRSQVELDKSKLNEFINGKVVLVTGGGGSIGSEIARQVLDYNPKKLIIFDIYENTTYELKTSLDMKYRAQENKPDYIALIGSVRDEARLDEVFNEYKPNIIFHAAAHKHVPLMEDSPYEAIKNNIKGTYNVAKMADKYKADKMVLISTDKAVRPTNVMGATKRFCEMVVEAWNKKSEHTKYSMVRFGNVLGSNGSVIPLFRRQIEAGGPVTVTSEEITRFFMTIPEACGLVIESGAYAEGGEKFILDMGEPVKIIDLARNMIKLSGLEVGKDIDIEITGLRPGEKLYEELLLKTSNATKTENDKIFVEKGIHPFDLDKIDEIINHLEEIGHDNFEVLEYLKKLEIIKKG